MTEQDVDGFTERLGSLAVIFRVDVEPMLIRGYFGALSDLEADHVYKAMNQAARESVHFPRPAELRDMAKRHRLRARQALDTKAALALPPGMSITPKPMDPKPIRLIAPASKAPAMSAERRRRLRESRDAALARLDQQARAMGITRADIERARAAAAREDEA